MRQIIYTIAAVLLINFNTNAQQGLENKIPDMKITGFNGKIENNNLSLVWNTNTTRQDNYWEVQASKDGKDFSTIGLVLGADPKQGKGIFRYKQELKKIRPGMKYYRVLHMEKGDWVMASNSIGLLK